MNYNYQKFNSGSKLVPIVIIHGWGGSIDSLSKLSAHIAKDSENPIFNLELPGFGSTELPNEIMTTPDYSDFVINFLKEKNLKNPILIGHSFGGKIIIDISSNHRTKIDKMVLINSSGLKPNNSLKKTFGKTMSILTPDKIKDNQTIKSVFYKKVLGESDYLNAEGLKDSLSIIVEEHYDEDIKNIDSPTLIIWGENDSYVPLWMGRKLDEDIPNSKLVVVPSATHGLPLKDPKITSELITQWLNK